MSLSAVIITRNEERNLRDCLESVRFVDQIVVVDSGSTDRTLDIAKQFTKCVYTHPFSDFASQKNFGISQAQTEWILVIDADERVTPELHSEIISVLKEDSGKVCYRVPRKTQFLGRWMHYSGMQDDKPIRLFRKGYGMFVQPIHEYFRPRGEAGTLANHLIHYTTPSIQREIEKTEAYTELESRYLKEKGSTPNSLTIALRVCGTFFHHYIRYLGCLDGLHGFLFAYYAARYTYIKYRKARELIRVNILEPQIVKVFEKGADRLPDWIESSDSRLAALLEAAGSLSGKKVLDVGCGKGRFARVMIEKGASIFGIDLSSNMLRSTRSLTGGHFVQASVTALPFADESFDVVYAVEVMEHLPSPERAIKEMSRTLKKGGNLLIVDRNRYSLSQKRFPVPNIFIKRWHELKNDWFYPRDFLFQERWFSRREVMRAMNQTCKNVSGRYIQSDGERNSRWHLLFDVVPPARIFVLWQGTKT